MPLYAKVKGPASYTVVGSPTIENGIASNFSSSSYLRLDSTQVKYLELGFKFKTTSSSRQGILRDQAQSNIGQLFLLVRDGGLLSFSEYYGSGWRVINSTFRVDDGDWHFAKVIRTGTTSTLYHSLDGFKFDLVGSLQHDGSPASSRLNIGNENTGAPFLGSIDLNWSYIKVNTLPYFGSSLTSVKVQSGLAKYNKSSGVVITDDVITDCSYNSHTITLTAPLILKDNEVEIVVKKTGGVSVFMNKFNSVSNTQLMTTSGNALVLYLPDSDGNAQPELFLYNVNSSTYLRFYKKSNGETVLSKSNDGVTWTSTTPTICDYSNTKVTTTIFPMRVNNDGLSTIENTIDLKETFIKVNGGYFFRGSDYYQNLSHYKIHQDTFSKYYTIVDGKLTWANPNIYLENTEENVDSRIIIDELFNPSTDALKLIFVGYNSENNGPIGGTFTTATTDNWRGFCVAKYYLSYDGFGVYVSGTGYQINTKNIFEIKNNGAYINNTQATGSASINEGATKLHLFLSRTSTTGMPITRTFRGKIYTFKWERNSKLFHHLVPVPKGLLIGNFVVPSNGMFDIATQTFYGNSGTGEFKIGGIPDDYIIEGGRMIWCNRDIYLGSSGTQRIDTGLNPDNSYSFEGDFYSTTVDRFLFGRRTASNGTSTDAIMVNTSGSIEAPTVYINYGNGGFKTSNDSVIKYNERFNVKVDGGKLYWNGKELISVTTELFTSANYTLWLFDVHQQAGSNRPMYGRCYYFNSLNNKRTVQYLVPVPKGILIGDKIAPSNCMFDLVTQTFFENQGTGEFIIGGLSGDYIFVGEDVVWSNPSIYLANDGSNRWIDTGYTSDKNGYSYEADIQFQGTGRQLMGFGGNWNEYWGRRDDTKLELGGQKTISVSSANDRVLAKYTWIYDSTTDPYSNSPKLKVGSTEVESSTQNNVVRTIVLSKKHWHLFRMNGYGSLFCNAKIFSHRIRNASDKLMQYLIPVTTGMRISGTTIPAPGMWDMVTKKFYGNAGTGSFTYGKDS